jgi:hypothetical protein
VGSVFDHHSSAAQFTDLIGFLVRNGHLCQVLLRFFYCFIQIRIEIGHDGLPFYRAFFHTIQQSFHVGREIHIHDGGECFLHHIVDHFPQFRNVEIAVLLGNISPGKDGGNGRRIGTGTSDAQFFHGTHQTGFGVMCRGLGKMLFRIKALEFQHAVLVQITAEHIFFFLIIFLGVDTHESIETHSGSCQSKNLVLCLNLHRSGIILCSTHAACHKSFPNQLIQTEQIPGKLLLDSNRHPVQIRGTDSFVGILNLLAVLLLRCCSGLVFFTVMNINKFRCLCLRLFGYTGRIGTQVGDQTNSALSLDIHTFI